MGTIYLDDSSKNELTHSAVREILRAYTAGLNHAGRAEFNGKTRQWLAERYTPEAIRQGLAIFGTDDGVLVSKDSKISVYRDYGLKVLS